MISDENLLTRLENVGQLAGFPRKPCEQGLLVTREDEAKIMKATAKRKSAKSRVVVHQSDRSNFLDQKKGHIS